MTRIVCLLALAALMAASDLVLPAAAIPINVRASAYGAKGNGVADDTAAIQKAIVAALTPGMRGGLVVALMLLMAGKLRSRCGCCG